MNEYQEIKAKRKIELEKQASSSSQSSAADEVDEEPCPSEKTTKEESGMLDF